MAKSLLHKQLGHPSLQVLSNVAKRYNLKISTNDTEFFCEACQFGKCHHAFPFQNFISHATKIFEFVHTDVWGPALSTYGFHYYILFIDDYNKFIWLYPLKKKSGTLVVFKQF